MSMIFVAKENYVLFLRHMISSKCLVRAALTIPFGIFFGLQVSVPVLPLVK